MSEHAKSVVLIIDGASGWPYAGLDGRTALEAADTPNLDALAVSGTCGLLHTIPEGMESSSAIACMSVLGFDPAEYYAGRGPIEALALGIDLLPEQVAMRCNLVTVEDGRMVSYAAGHVSSEESHQIVRDLNEALGSDRVSFYPGVGFRHIVTIRDGVDVANTICTPPHDIPGEPVARHLPEGPAGFFLQDLMDRSRDLLAEHPVNRSRRDRGDLEATQIWLFWPGMQAAGMPSFEDTYGLRGTLTSGVDLLEGLARQVSLDVLELPGVTDGPDNDYEGQMCGALEALTDHDLAVVHVEAPDEAGHSGDAAGKVGAIEAVDRLMVPQVTGRDDLSLLVLPDHPTPLESQTHADDPVPFIAWGRGFEPNGAASYSEEQAASTGLDVMPGHSLMGRFLRRAI